MSIGTAFSAFFGTLFNKEKAELWNKANAGKLIPDSKIDEYKESALKAEGKVKSAEEKVSSLEAELKSVKEELNKPSSGDDAVYTLALLQREGRLIDFLQEDISTFEDAQVGAAVRQIHEGCKKVLDKHFEITPVVDAAEGEKTTVAKDFDPSLYELSGNVSGEPPYTGELRHKGWKTDNVDLPVRQKGRNNSVIYPAEIEV